MHLQFTMGLHINSLQMLINNNVIVIFCELNKFFMDKYTILQKTKSTTYCSYNRSVSKSTKEQLTIKITQSNDTWQQILLRKQIIVAKQFKFKFLPKIREIIKQQKEYYIVYQQLGENLEDLISKQLSYDDILNFAQQIIEIIFVLYTNKIFLLQIKPQYFFVYRKQIKLAHFPSELDTKYLFSQETQMQNKFRYLSPEIVFQNSQIDQDTMIFNLGCIISQLCLHDVLIKAKDKIEYMYKICYLFPKQISYLKQAPKMQILKKDTFVSRLEKTVCQYQLQDLLQTMLKIKKDQRISLQQSINKLKLIKQQYMAIKKQIRKEQQNQKKKSKELLGMKLQRLRLNESTRLKMISYQNSNKKEEESNKKLVVPVIIRSSEEERLLQKQTQTSEISRKSYANRYKMIKTEEQQKILITATGQNNKQIKKQQEPQSNDIDRKKNEKAVIINNTTQTQIQKTYQKSKEKTQKIQKVVQKKIYTQEKQKENQSQEKKNKENYNQEKRIANKKDMDDNQEEKKTNNQKQQQKIQTKIKQERQKIQKQKQIQKQVKLLNLNLIFDNQMQNLSESPIIQRDSKPLRDQKNIDDNVFPAKVKKTNVELIIPPIKHTFSKKKSDFSNHTNYAALEKHSQAQFPQLFATQQESDY